MAPVVTLLEVAEAEVVTEESDKPAAALAVGVFSKENAVTTVAVKVAVGALR